ncbi:MAG: lysophospholipase [Sneathiellales bacterium]|nr:lysophospholipase [Sneathiellales bacterium]
MNILFKAKNLLSVLVLMGLFSLSPAISVAASPSESEEQVCSYFGFEGWIFNRWRALANEGSALPFKQGILSEELSLSLPDGTKLSGYRISANEGQQARRAVLVLLGNAMRTDKLRNILTYFARRDFDVFTFDYRGYGKSGGKPLLKIIGKDQIEVTRYIQSLGYPRLYLYGMSMGGIFAMSPHMPRDAFNAIAIDSSPARFPWYAFCPVAYDPVSNVPDDSSNILVISGDQDKVVPASDVKPLGKAVEKKGGRYLNRETLGHPLMDSGANTAFRFGKVVNFFKSRE